MKLERCEQNGSALYEKVKWVDFFFALKRRYKSKHEIKEANVARAVSTTVGVEGLGSRRWARSKWVLFNTLSTHY